MKNIQHSILVLSVLMIFSACKKQEQRTTFVDTTEGPLLTIENESITAAPGETISILYTVTTDSGITEIRISSSDEFDDLISDVTLSSDDLAGSENNYIGTFEFTLPTDGSWAEGDEFEISIAAEHVINSITYTSTQSASITYVEDIGAGLFYGPTLIVAPESIEGWYGDSFEITYYIETPNGIESLSIESDQADTTSIPNVYLTDDNGYFDGSENEYTGTFSFDIPPNGLWSPGEFITISFEATNVVNGVELSTNKSTVVTFVIP